MIWIRLKRTGLNAWRALLAILLLGIVGCTDEQSSTGEATSKIEVATSETQRGPVKLTIEVSPKSPRLSDEPTLTLTIVAEKGVRVEKPPFGEALGEFVIRDFVEPAPKIDDRVDIIQQIYTLEPARAGRLTIAPIAVTFFDERENGGGAQYTIESEAISVNVTTVLAEEAPTLADLKPAADPVELPTNNQFAWLVVAAILVGFAAAIVLAWKLRQRGGEAVPQLTPRQWAQRELERIEALARTDAKAFYVELTGVIRRYIERSTGVRAPEQTTEEFLREIVAGAIYADDDQKRLGDFLQSADLVKFAGMQPTDNDIDASLDRAKEFIELESNTPAEEIAA